ncbi:hypothetical protein ACOSQ3_000006 [Xanthoceras sorbifolium]
MKRMERSKEPAILCHPNTIHGDGVSTSVPSAWAWAATAIRIGPCLELIGGPACDRSTSDRGALPAPIRFPSDNFKHSLILFSKSFSFPHGTCVYRSFACI